ncbi:tRNA uridine-5-carboxymethylaminomethyl(34) synthesis enzyme MnmG [bacterium]|nr:tRNA uridine-5-carboxymethylaminomethyl(34) synthesis enzyme MnmG [bacterium]
MSHNEFDIIVVGGGHAGIEAALAAARLGARCALVTHDPAEIGRMPCNPAIGGLGKGHLVREIDVLGGEMGRAIDATGIQFRVLNTKKGPAVQSPRAQADKHAYQAAMTATCHAQPGLTVIGGDVAGLLVAGADADRRIEGVVVGTREVRAPRVVLCTGTFMKGLMHVGDARTSGGREGAASSEGLSGSLADYGFALRRLKTGTPPRLRADSIDFQQLAVQLGDAHPTPFSFRTRRFAPEQIACHLAYTNATTHAIIAASLDRSPLYGGVIEGRGPRYCPSIEDKVVRFADKDRHLLFLEPEGRDTDEIYVNGLSTSLPADVQERVVRSIPGLERAELVRYGYAVEYDSVPSWQIHAHLETKVLSGLYLAGQILGTSGYEEAAGQGLVAGLNAVRSLDGRDPLQLGRHEAYLGVLVDDLVTKDIEEPYRMFTSRAEHRLRLRCDNAEERLAAAARDGGLLPGPELAVLDARRRFVADFRRALGATAVVTRDTRQRLTAAEFLRFPGIELGSLPHQAEVDAESWSEVMNRVSHLRDETDNPFLAEAAARQVVHDIKYDGYIAKHERLIRHQAHLDAYELPSDMDYKTMSALSFEAREKLDRVRPDTLGQAGRIDGVRAGDLAVLTVFLKKRAGETEAGNE